MPTERQRHSARIYDRRYSRIRSNHLINSTWVLVEHSIGRLKHYARLADPYDGTMNQFNHEFNVITGLANLRLLWDKIDKGPPPPGRWGTSID